MITLFFKGVLSTSLSVAPIIVLLIAVRPFLRKHYTIGSLFTLWLLVGIRLVMTIQLPNISPIVVSTGEPIVSFETDMSLISRAFAETSFIQESESIMATPIMVYSISWFGIFAMGWFCGFVIILGAQILLNIHSHRKLLHWSIPVDDEQNRIFELCKCEQNIRNTIPLYKCVAIATPLLLGLFRPCVLIPNSTVSDWQLQYALRHELVHYKRRDLWFKLLLLIVCSMHWFNPLVWIMAKMAEIDMEISCDRDVLKICGDTSRKDYGLAMLKFIDSGKNKLQLLTTRFLENKKQLRTRFESIMDTKTKKRGSMLVLLMTLLLGISLTFLGCGAVDLHKQTIPANSNNENEQQMIWPVPGHYSIESGYGMRYDGQDFHSGISIVGKDIEGEIVVAAQDGTVLFANSEFQPGVGYGMYIMIEHGGNISTLYAHLSKIDVAVGDKIKAGQTIGIIGDTGFTTDTSLHFEVREDGVAVDPENYFVHPGDIEAATEEGIDI